jgi:hypothetical protein
MVAYILQLVNFYIPILNFFKSFFSIVVSNLVFYGIFPKPKFMKNIMLFGHFDSFVLL